MRTEDKGKEALKVIFFVWRRIQAALIMAPAGRLLGPFTERGRFLSCLCRLQHRKLNFIEKTHRIQNVKSFIVFFKYFQSHMCVYSTFNQKKLKVVQS